MRGYGRHLNQRVPNRATRRRHLSLCKWCRERTCCPNTVLAHTVLTNLGDGFALLCQHGQGVTNTQGGIPQEAQPVTRRTCACVGLCSDRLAVGSHYACDQQFRACATAFDKSAKINAVVQAHMQQQKQLYVAAWLCVCAACAWLAVWLCKMPNSHTCAPARSSTWERPWISGRAAPNTWKQQNNLSRVSPPPTACCAVLPTHQTPSPHAR